MNPRIPTARSGRPSCSPRRRAGGPIALLLVGALLSAACVTHPVGPVAVRPARLGYNDALVRSADEQLLLNIVRLRYRDNPSFLDVSSVVAQYGRFARAEATLSAVDPGGLRDGALSGGVELSEDPVISFTPLRGEEFARRLLAPLGGNELVALAFSGWSIERLLRCCVQEIHGVRNGISASGPTPATAPEFERFQTAAHSLRTIQLADGLSFDLDETGGVNLDFDRLRDRVPQAEFEVLRQALDLPQDAMRVRLVAPKPNLKENEVTFLGRSMLGILYYLSQAVEVPAEHEARGWVTVTRDRDGGRFDWARLTGGVFRVQSGATRPTVASVAVRHRGAWFWIADDDLDSKSTFNLVTLLLAVKSGETKGTTPLLAISN